MTNCFKEVYIKCDIHRGGLSAVVMQVWPDVFGHGLSACAGMARVRAQPAFVHLKGDLCTHVYARFSIKERQLLQQTRRRMPSAIPPQPLCLV